MAGRPSLFTEELATQICEYMIMGESLRTIGKREDMPAASTICLWLTKHPGFMEQYTRAREAQMEAMGEDILAIADDSSQDTHTTTYENGVERTSPNTEWISRSRLRCDKRQWLMSKYAPKRFGDKIEQTVQGADGGPVRITSTFDMSGLLTYDPTRKSDAG